MHRTHPETHRKTVAAPSTPDFFLLPPDAVNGMVIRRCLEVYELTTEVTGSVEELVSRLEHRRPSGAVLVEPFRHPGAIAKVRAILRASGARLPVIAVTADAMAPSRDRYLGEGAAAVVTLPAGPDQLSAEISAAVEAWTDGNRAA